MAAAATCHPSLPVKARGLCTYCYQRAYETGTLDQHPTLRAATAAHGTRSCYVQGCRRPECVAANTDYQAAWRARRLAEGRRLLHGRWVDTRAAS